MSDEPRFARQLSNRLPVSGRTHPNTQISRLSGSHRVYIGTQMEFGHLNDLRGVDFSLPPDDPRTTALLGGHRRIDARARVGLPVWTQKSWVGGLYPPKTPAREFLSEYSKQFGTVELNSTHYAIPDAGMTERWRKSVTPEFRFCPKILQEISHDLGRRDLPAITEAYFLSLEQLGGTLGPYFLQLPPHFGPDRLAFLQRFFALVPATARLAVELRHPGWFAKGRLIDAAFDAFSAAGVATVISDVAARRDVSHASVTAPRLIVRFVGNQGHPTDEPRIAAWAERLARWFDQGLEELYFFVHQPDNSGSPEMASRFVHEMKRRTSVPGLWDWKRWNEKDQLALL